MAMIDQRFVEYQLDRDVDKAGGAGVGLWKPGLSAASTLTGAMNR
jgi:hypothetical protein